MGNGRLGEARRAAAASAQWAILTGVGTVNADDPSLKVRASELDSPYSSISADVTRTIAVVDSWGRMSPNAALCNAPSLIHYSQHPGNIANKGQSIEAPLLNRRVDLQWVLSDLAGRDCHEVLAECGSTLAGALVASCLADEIVLYLAPKLMGQDARPLLDIAKIDSMQAVKSWQLEDVRQVGQDLRLTMLPPIDS